MFHRRNVSWSIRISPSEGLFLLSTAAATQPPPAPEHQTLPKGLCSLISGLRSPHRGLVTSVPRQQALELTPAPLGSGPAVAGSQPLWRDGYRRMVGAVPMALTSSCWSQARIAWESPDTCSSVVSGLGPWPWDLQNPEQVSVPVSPEARHRVRQEEDVSCLLTNTLNNFAVI